MNRNANKDFEKILNNKKLGSSEIVRLLNKHLLVHRYPNNELKRKIRTAKEKLGHFEAVKSYLGELLVKLRSDNEEKLLKFFNQFEEEELNKHKGIFDKIYPEVKNINKIITLSRSSTVVEVLKLLHKKNNNLSIIVCESRPQFEGRLTAEEFAKSGIKVLLIADAMMGMQLQEADAAIIGADVILKNGDVVNKAGSKSLALLCKESNRPFYVVSTNSKRSSRVNFKQKEENPNEIWNKKVKHLSTLNIYFEVVEKKYISQIFTD